MYERHQYHLTMNNACGMLADDFREWAATTYPKLAVITASQSTWDRPSGYYGVLFELHPDYLCRPGTVVKNDGLWQEFMKTEKKGH